jgi:hypothetical protein
MIPDDVSKTIYGWAEFLEAKGFWTSDDEFVLDWLDAQPAMRKWDTMPTESGWYWFDGSVEWDAYPDDEYHSSKIQTYKTVVAITGYNEDEDNEDLKYMLVNGEFEVYESQCWGTWYGPLTPPWEDNNDTG